MQTRISVYLAFICLFLFISSSIFAEYVFLKDGKIIGGSIISETADNVVIRDKKRKAYRIKRSNILRILYTDIYMGKVYVQKNDGKGIVCFMVDEDRETYTFRMDLYKPEEFVIRRDSVLFIARGNPSGLQVEGDPDYNDVNVKWFPPYNQIKGYRVYVKEADDRNAEWKENIFTRFKSVKLKKLRSNTEYYAIVKAVDSQGDESPPSNEIKFKTKNRAPNKVEELTFENISKDEKSVRIKIKWRETVDTDGKVASYKIYKIQNGKRIFEAQIRANRKTEYTFKKDDDFEEVIITAVDDLDAESNEKYLGLRFRKEFNIGIYTGLVVPFGKLAEVSYAGYSFGLKGDFQNFYFAHSVIGFNLQVASFVPKHDYDYQYDEDEINAIIVTPLTVNFGYSFRPTERIVISPLFNIGAAGVILNYSFYSLEDGKKKTVTEYEFLPIYGMSCAAYYYINEKFFLNSLLEYSSMIEFQYNFSFLSLSIGAGIRF